MRKRNHWAVHRNPLFEWVASVPIRLEAPSDLVEWTKEVIILAETNQIAEFRRPDGSWWSSDELFAYLDRRVEQDQVVDAFGFSSGFKRTRSRLAYFDRLGIFEEPVDDVGELLIRLRGPISDEKAHSVDSTEALWVFGYAIDYKPDATGMAARSLPSTSVAFGTRCDIWLPWVAGKIEHEPHDELYDNRELAAHHSTRLNRFLDEVRRITIDRGGTWQFTNYPDLRSIDAMAGPDGISFPDKPPPRGRYVPPEGR